MTTFIRRGAAIKRTNPSTILGKQIDEFLATHTNPDTGTVTDPGVLGRAAQMAKGDNSLDGLKKQADIQNQLAKLNSKLNNAYATKGMLDYNFKNAQYQIGKAYSGNPGQLIQHMYDLYDFHAAQIENHVARLKKDGIPADALQVYGGTISDQAAQYEKLIDAINQPQGFKSKLAQLEAQNFGMAIGTDSEGKITSFALHVIPSGTQDARLTLKDNNGAPSTTFIRTGSTYGGIPVYVIPQSDPSDPSGKSYVAKVGDLSFAGQKNNITQGALELKDNRNLFTKLLDSPFDLVERTIGAGGGGLFKGQPLTGMGDRAIKGEGIKAAAGTEGNMVPATDLFGHIKTEDFSNMTSLPAGSLATDPTGNFYYVNDDGTMFAAPTADIMSAHLGIPPKQIQSSAMPIHSQDLETLQSQQNPDARANMWLTDPSENSPLNQNSGPTSMLTSPNQSDVAISTPAAPPGGTAPPQPTSQQSQAGPRAIQKPGGRELAQDNTKKITTGSVPLPNAEPNQQPVA